MSARVVHDADSKGIGSGVHRPGPAQGLVTRELHFLDKHVQAMLTASQRDDPAQ